VDAKAGWANTRAPKDGRTTVTPQENQAAAPRSSSARATSAGGGSTDTDVELAALRAERAQLLDELEVAYEQLAEVLSGAASETALAYLQLRRKNEELEGRLQELEQAHVELQETQQMLLHSERLSAMGRLAATLAHEIRNPLAAIAAQAELLRLKVPELDCPPGVQPILDGVRRLDRLADNILRFSRARTPEIEDVDLNRVVEDVLSMLRPLAGSQARIDLFAATDALMVRANQGCLEQVITNLVMNGIDASGARRPAPISVRTGRARIDETAATEKARGREVHLALGAHGEAAGPGCPCVEVEDRGSGIEPALLPQVFEPFFTTKEAGKGTGLGLAICRNIARECGGNLLLATRPGAGTSVRLFVPGP